ncbi:class I SAM-dependent methyltransferase [Cognaticolwellia beringensis]|nr:class I SAM-dependent methyltransferase [Cognaticolwellia beringensis]
MIIFDILLLMAVMFIAGTLIYSSVKLGISPMPSSRKAYKVMSDLVDKTGTGPIIDLGSGWGNFVIPIAKSNRQRQVIGYEMSTLPWLISTLLKQILGLSNLTLHRENFYHASLPAASVIVCYLYPQAMIKIQAKLLLEQPKIDFLISNNFALPALQPDAVIMLDDFYKSPVYLYKIADPGTIQYSAKY